MVVCACFSLHSSQTLQVTCHWQFENQDQTQDIDQTYPPEGGVVWERDYSTIVWGSLRLTPIIVKVRTRTCTHGSYILPWILIDYVYNNYP